MSIFPLDGATSWAATRAATWAASCLLMVLVCVSMVLTTLLTGSGRQLLRAISASGVLICIALLVHRWFINQSLALWPAVGAILAIIIFGVTGRRSPAPQVVCRLGPFSWDLNNFCRGWSITGMTGSGKTVSAIKRLMHQLFTNVPNWGGVCVDEKGSFYETMIGIADHFRMRDKLVVLQVRPEDAGPDWKPQHTFNLLSYPGIPPSTYAKIICDTASSVSAGANEKGFFKTQALIHIAEGIRFLDIKARILRESTTKHVRLNAVFDLLSSQDLLRKSIESAADELNAIINRLEIPRLFLDHVLPETVDNDELEIVVAKMQSDTAELDALIDQGRQVAILCQADRRGFCGDIPASKLFKPLLTGFQLRHLIEHGDLTDAKKQGLRELLQLLDEFMACAEHFNRKFLNQPTDQLGGVVSTIFNYLQFFTNPDIAQVFCSEENTVDFRDIDQGKVFVIVMPQKYATERQYINTFVKLLYYTHAMRRFDYSSEYRSNANLLVFWADEAQGVVTAAEGGMEDYNVIDKIREARATVVFAAQSTTSYLPKLDEKKTKVMLLNLANQIYFQAADNDGAKLAAESLGKHEYMEKSYGFSGGRRSINYSKKEAFKIKDFELRTMKKFQCVIKHCEQGFLKTILPPVDDDGTIPEWFR